MKLKKLHVTLLLIAALLLGFAGAFLGVKLAQPDSDPDEELADLTNSSEQNNGTAPENMEKVTQTYNLIKEHYLEDVEDSQLIEGAIQGMISSLEDPYSSYMDVESMEQFNETIESSFEGIGAEVSMVNGKVTIVSPIKDSPAEDAGLRPNDHILSVDGESVEGLNLNEAVEKIRGEKGSEVVLEVQRSSVSDSFDVTIVRDDIPVETVYSEVQTIEGKKTGIIEITSFAENTAEHFTQQLQSLEDENIEGLVIDVRGNPGGVLSAVEGILKNFIPKDIPYVQIENQNGEAEKSYSELDEKKPYPISVLINEGSASASEILAVAMKEVGYDVVGTNSFGKGTVQQAVPVGEDGSRVKLTFFKWLSPEGTWIHEKGVEPTTEVEQPDYYFTNPVQIEDSIAYDQTGENVENIQVMLAGLGYDPGRTDGYYSKETASAVQNFQADNDLETTGEVDEETAGLIETSIVDRVRNGEDDRQMKQALDILYD
ncbi:carboxyl-terminal processing protease [Lentibacillus halodurans]|uniref:Carboxyl-terminal processing protease n=1 Tax=Lentibacillus halodurans TaxID=237679 RepID=A0A1I0WJ07_9BACI|nr:S41 family peptidase [Lentibacillus halodurans]SFA88544.1 carboxyl-terminal processing protease [Lentibacillus halodurans]